MVGIFLEANCWSLFLNDTLHQSHKFFDKLIAFSFYALIFFIPISIALTAIFTTLSLVGYLIKRFFVFLEQLSIKDEQRTSKQVFILFLQSYKPPINPLNKPISIWLLVFFISVLISTHPGLSYKAFLGKTLQSVFLYFNFVEAIRTIVICR